MHTILIVDDDKTIVDILSQYLTEMGYRVLTAYDGDTGLEALKMSPEIVMVVLDLQMPRMNGYEAFRKMKAVRPDVKVIISSTLVTNSKQALYEMGVDGVLAKPYPPDMLSSAIKSLL